ncbi:uncharacterized protein LOC113316228 [Papaver somniferum]|uniref:uncharacterized protein LOC113316228 n=1 Tax=Papaver somniferum TaxID=3469 RepID=UPI000E6FC068|nr:uncharacterized protein LOC113316228 [Papaver somniferum]
MERMMQQISAVIVPLHERNMEHANAMYQNQQRPRYDLYSNTYNPGWRDHPNFSYANKQAAANPTFNQQGGYQFMQRPHQESQGTSADDKFTLLMQGSGKLPSQPLNHNENVNAIEIRSGKQVKQPTTSPDANGPVLDQEVDETAPNKAEIYEISKNIQVNIPLLEAIRQVPRYAKFLKELCTNKHKLVGNEVMYVGENASAYLQKKLPPKLKDPGSFTIPCTIGTTRFDRALLDLGATINVMPASIYESLDLGPLKDTDIIIQLADRSTTYPKRVVEDVLVQVNKLIFPADFYVLDMRDEDSPSSTPLLLGRPFMRTARTKIDVFKGTITMKFDGEPISFNIFEAMRYPSDVHSCFLVDVVDSLAQQMFELDGDDALEKALTKSLDCANHNDMKSDIEMCDELKEVICSLAALQEFSPRNDVSYISLPCTNEKLLPSILQAPVLELKPLPYHLKYVYLGDKEELPVIIAKNLTKVQEENLIRVLREYKSAIGWTIADIKGISPSMCMHRILLEEGAKPTREAQRRLHPPMMEVVKKEILKLLDVGLSIPYPITHG